MEVICYEACDAEMSPEAKACAQCGHPNELLRLRRLPRRLRVWCAVLLLGFLVLIGLAVERAHEASKIQNSLTSNPNSWVGDIDEKWDARKLRNIYGGMAIGIFALAGIVFGLYRRERRKAAAYELGQRK